MEQGPTLAASGQAIGSVSEIVGMLGGELVIEARAGHAGTSRCRSGRMAAVAAARATVALTEAFAMSLVGGLGGVRGSHIGRGGVRELRAEVELGECIGMQPPPVNLDPQQLV